MSNVENNEIVKSRDLIAERLLDNIQSIPEVKALLKKNSRYLIQIVKKEQINDRAPPLQT